MPVVGRLVSVAMTLACLSRVAHALELTFEDRVRAQEALERVYYPHQIGAPKAFEEAASSLALSILQRRSHTF